MPTTNQHFVSEIERAFLLTIPDDVSENTESVGQLFDWLSEYWSAKPSANHSLCNGSTYLLEKAFCELGVPTPITANTPLSALLPSWGRRAFWTRLGELSNLELPSLVRPKWVVWFGVALVLTSSVSVASFLDQRTDSRFLAFFYGIFILVFGGLFTHMFTEPFATVPSKDWRGFDELTQIAIVRNSRTLQERGCTWTTDDIWFVLQTIIIESYGVERDEISKGMTFIGDLEIE